MSNTKIRYERLFNPVEEREADREREAEMTEQEREKIQIEEMWAERCHDEQRGKVNLGRERCTNVKTNG